MRTPVAVAALIAALLPAVAPAQPFVGLRAAYGLPGGDFVKSRPLEDAARALVPITLDLGLMIGRTVAVGAYASYGVVLPARSWRTACDASGSDCSAADLRIGAQLNVHADTEGTGLWGGVAMGYEELRTKDSLGPLSELTWKGYDATLQCGLDFRPSPGFRIGPFANLTVGHFRWVESTAEANLPDTELHGWLQLGLRGLWGS
jgi:hypothetical protein